MTCIGHCVSPSTSGAKSNFMDANISEYKLIWGRFEYDFCSKISPN